jgi:hypothetical protein
VVNTIRVWPDFHLRMVRSSTSSRLASWMSVRGISPGPLDFVHRGFCQFLH